MAGVELDHFIERLNWNLYHLNTSVNELINYVNQNRQPPPLEDDNDLVSNKSKHDTLSERQTVLDTIESKESRSINKHHKWKESELKMLCEYYSTFKGEWSDTVSYELLSAIPVSEDALYFKWEHCRNLETGGRYSKNGKASSLHKQVWKKLGYKY